MTSNIIPRPPSVTPQFVRAIRGDPANCILWVGAGLSRVEVRDEGKGFPDWEKLMNNMIEDLERSNRCDKKSLARLEGLLSEGRYLEIAQEYERRTSLKEFNEFLRDQLDPDPDDIIASEIHQIILDVGFRGIITTNFDRVFEKQDSSLQPLVYPQFLEEPNSFQKKNFFLKIHGCIRLTSNPAKNLVLTEESYSKVRQNQRYRLILFHILLTRPILTVGYSGLNDPDFVGLLDDLKEIFQDDSPTIYALMRKPLSAEKAEMKPSFVQIIPYKDSTELLEFFKWLRAKSKLCLLYDWEKDIIYKYLKTREMPEGFRVLLNQCQNMRSTSIAEEIEMVKNFLEKAELSKEKF